MAEKEHSGPELHRLQALLDASRLLNSTLELKEIIGIILDVVRAEVPVERLSVYVVDRARGVLHSIVAQEVENLEISLPLGRGIAGTVAATGEVLDIPDAYADPRFERSFDQKLAYHTRDLFTLPVYNRQGEIIGVLELINRPRPIGAADREFLLGISVYIGLALQNACSHSQLRAEGDFDQHLFMLRDRLAEAERLSLTSRLFHHVLKEINNPLAVAMSYAELARQQRGLPEELVGYLNKVAQGIDQTATAARRFRDFVDFGSLNRTSLSLAAVIREISQLRTQEWTAKNINAALFIQDAPNVFADEAQMQLAILFLFKNAESSLALADGGRELQIGLSNTDEHVRIEVIDTGSHKSCNSGVPLSTTTMQPSGADLNLALASSIIEQHRGRVRRESNESGNRVVVELPIDQADP
jgi:C4-dicarboxylate-specific signal transduction histidine kinase